jgi:hypothetical protein
LYHNFLQDANALSQVDVDRLYVLGTSM